VKILVEIKPSKECASFALRFAPWITTRSADVMDLPTRMIAAERERESEKTMTGNAIQLIDSTKDA